MGLDVYVGSLTRYFTRDWKTVLQQAAEAGEGPPVEIVRPGGADEAPADPEEVRAAVVAWRSGISAALAKHAVQGLDWDESPGAPYFTDRPDWHGYGALLLWAAREEHPDLRPAAESARARRKATRDWTDDPAYRASVAEGFRSRYDHLLRDVGVWLPVDVPFTFQAEWITGDGMAFGSSVRLAGQLDDLNARTWRAGPDDLAAWSREGAGPADPPEIQARFAFALVRRLARDSVGHRLPMLLDY